MLGALELARTFSAADFQLLIEQTCKLRRDPAEYRKEVERQDNEQFLADNKSTVFVSADGEMFNMEEFL